VPTHQDDGLVEAVPVNTANAPKAQLVRPANDRPAAPAVAAATPTASGQTYVVQSGDNVWRIANRFKVDQQALMKINGISDPKKLKLGMSLTIPR
jgi:LysM repeat protein